MEIVFFINTLGSGGAEHQLVTLADGLVERGYHVTIATFGDIEDHYEYNYQIKRHRIAPGKNKVIKMLAIWWYFLTLKADWVVGFGQRESRYMLEALKWRNRNMIHAIAGERNTTIGAPNIHERRLIGGLYDRADYIVPNSYSQRKHIIDTKPEYKSKTVTITNYTDLLKYLPFTLSDSSSVRICVFARYDPQKNCEMFVDAIKLLREKTCQDFTIEWYGNKHFKDKSINPYYISMKAKVDEYGLQDCLILHDQIKNVSEVMTHYDAFCLPSLWEGFSNSISEAICCGMPCLVSNVADNGVMVQEGINGFLFDPHQKESIISAFLKYFSLSFKDRQLFGNASRKRAEELFDRNKFIDAYVKLLN